MISRREFLSSAALGLSGFMMPGRSPSIATQENNLLGPIAELSSMNDQAEPITAAERRFRIEKARRLMKQHNIDAVLMMGGTTLDYFTGMKWRVRERMLAVVIPQKGESFMICPAFEEARAMEQLENGPLAGSVSILTWEEHDNPYQLIEQGLATGKLGIEETVRYVFSNGIANEAASLSLTDAIPITGGCRSVKDSHELELMRLASKVTVKAYKAAYQAAEVGMTQDDFSN